MEMTWREEAKELGISMLRRKKEDVLRDIEVAKNVCKDVEVEDVEICKDIKIIVRPEEATEICRKALFEHVSGLGMVNVTCEKWFVNCKRKGIVFKGQKNDNDKLVETEIERSEGSGASQHVSAGVAG